jgi:plastocyanin
MRFYGSAVVLGAFALAACGGNETATADSMAVDTAMPAATAPSPAAATVPGSGAPITGTTHEVRMVGDEKGYRFEPNAITVAAGDGIRFINASGGPHNVAADPAKIADDVEAQLSANMPNQMSPLTGPLLMNIDEAYTISFGAIKPGSYELNCTPHLAMGMLMTVTVK